ncbi:hypothetical protein EJB05_54036, partial [Eragrostis curvula]
MAPVTLSLFKETPDHRKGGESAYPKREEGHSQSGESTSKDSNDLHDLNLDLKLAEKGNEMHAADQFEPSNAAPMEGSSSRDGHEGGERGSSSPKKGKRSAEIALEKPLEPKRVPEIVNLEKIRIQKVMKRINIAMHIFSHLLISFDVFFNLSSRREIEWQQIYSRLTSSLSLLLLVLHCSRLKGIMTLCLTNVKCETRPAGTSESASYANPSNMAPVTPTLFKETPDYLKGMKQMSSQLHMEGESDYPKREEGHSQSGESSSKDSSDPHDLDLDLKLTHILARARANGVVLGRMR